MPKEPQKDKFRNLRHEGTLNPKAQAVVDDLFANGHFFDPCDIVQVKYEMLRRVAMGGQSIGEVIRAFGFSSRQSFYTARAAFEQNGLEGLIPYKRGPKEAHKITTEVLEFIRRIRKENPSLSPRELAERIRRRFHLNVHQKSIERALARIQEEA